MLNDKILPRITCLSLTIAFSQRFLSFPKLICMKWIKCQQTLIYW